MFQQNCSGRNSPQLKENKPRNWTGIDYAFAQKIKGIEGIVLSSWSSTPSFYLYAFITGILSAESRNRARKYNKHPVVNISSFPLSPPLVDWLGCWGCYFILPELAFATFLLCWQIMKIMLQIKDWFAHSLPIVKAKNYLNALICRIMNKRIQSKKTST